MELYLNLCKCCGGTLNAFGEGQYKCKYCGRVYDSEAVENQADKMRKLFDEYKLEALANAKKNLYDAVSAEYVSSFDVRACCQVLKQIDPDDFGANFYEVATGTNARMIAKAIREIDVEENAEYLDGVIRFLIRSLQTEYKLDLDHLIARAFENRDPVKFERYSTQLSEEAVRVDRGVYETKLPREVFLAYSGKDMKAVSELTEVLEAQGLRCFVAARNLRHGKGAVENYNAALSEAMDFCRSVVFVSSTNSRSFNCDALTIELPYIKEKDLEHAPAEYRNNYKALPQRYKKPRVEYRIGNSAANNTADLISNEFFDGYERVYSPDEVAARVMKQLTATVSAEPKPQSEVKKTKVCMECFSECPESAKFCMNCGGKEFAGTKAEAELKKQLLALQKEKQDWETNRQASAKQEAERLEKERLEKERLEKERLEKERLEKERLARERQSTTYSSTSRVMESVKGIQSVPSAKRNTLKFDGGDLYEGETLVGKAHGEGIRIYANGDQYDGSWRDGRRNGRGIYSYASGEKYDGEYLNDKKQGYGIYYFSNGNRYEGEWQNGKKHGRGAFYYASGVKLEGDFRDDTLTGKGVGSYLGGDRYEGDFYQYKRHGRGVYSFANGNRYDGEFQDGKKQGHGIFYYANGVKLEGDFRDDTLTGRGVGSYVSGDRYEGEFREYKRHGRGVYFFANGNRYDGEWVDGNKQGHGTFYFASGVKLEGDFRNDTLTGRGVGVYDGGARYEGEFREYKRHGRGVYFFPNGNRYDGEWVDGNKQGHGIFYFAGGTKLEGEFKNDALNGKGVGIYADGGRYEGDFVDYKRHGHGTYYFPDGTKYVGEWRDGKRLS